MANLNEDVLRLIFDYLDTPLDWVQVSEVCKLWKAAASKQWRTASNLKIGEEELLILDEQNNASVISLKDANRMVYCVAPFVQVLSVSTISARLEDLIISFGSFRYKVRGRAGVILKLLAQNATKITEIFFEYPPETKLLSLLINGNNIKKVTVAESDAFFEHISTKKIEDLCLIFKNPQCIKSFKKHFPNLKNLELELDFRGGTYYSMEMKQKLSLILPYVLGLRSLQLHLFTFHKTVRIDVCSGIKNLSQLENLSLEFTKYSKVTSIHQFLNQLSIGCPKLRAVKLANLQICEKELGVLLTLPNLESLDVSTVMSFSTLELPQMIKLSELRIGYDDEDLSLTNVGSALRMMPKLKILQIEKKLRDFWFKTDVDHSCNRIPELISEVVKVAVSQEKDVVVRNARTTNSKELRISNINVPLYSEVESMTVMTPFMTTDFLERVKELVQKSLKCHYSII